MLRTGVFAMSLLACSNVEPPVDQSPSNTDMAPPADMMLAGPIITAISPGRLLNTGGEVIVKGANLRSGLTATIDGVPAPANLISATEARLMAPARPGRFGPVETLLRNTDGQTARDTRQLSYYLSALEFKSGANPFAMGAGTMLVRDVSNDGKPDVITATKGSLAVARGDGGGGLATATLYPLTSCPTAGDLVLADFTGDKIADAVTSCFEGQTILLLPGKGDGSFGAGVPTTTTTRPQALASGDVNKDGKEDLVVSHGSLNQTALWVLLGKGDGTFQSPVKLPITDQATTPEYNQPCTGLADFNLDGNLDAYVCLYAYGKVGVFLGNGDGTFNAMSNVSTGKYPILADTGDVNADGAADLVVSDNQSNTVGIYLSKGDGTFRERLDYAMGFMDPRQPRVVDLNKDGLLDVAVGNYSGTSLSILINNGDGTFSLSAVRPVIPINSLYFRIGDLNSDGLPELLFSTSARDFAVLGNVSR